MIEFIAPVLAIVFNFAIVFWGFKFLATNPNKITKQRREEIRQSREILKITEKTMLSEVKGNDSLDDMIRYHKENEVVHYEL